MTDNLNQQVAAQPQGAATERVQVAGPLAGVFATVAPEASSGVPEPASAKLSWDAAGEHMVYRATAGHLDVRDDTGRLTAKMFSLSYVALGANGASDPARPVTFAYNGGPGSASVAVNFGGIGPRRVATDGTAHLSAAAPVEDNPYTLLRQSDLVFLDAPGTGWSPLAADADPKKVFGVDGDADAFFRAICDWLERNGRWSSPVYLFGESYGTVRNAALMRLAGERGLKLTGVVMLSAIWDWAQTLPGEDLYYLGMMPTYAAAAQWFHKAGEGVDPDEWFDQAMAFSEDVLAPALLKGSRLPREREHEVAGQLAAFIGLPADFVEARHLRVTLDDVRGRLLAKEGKACGRLDMRFASDAPSYVQDSSEWFGAEDAADDAVDGAWTKAFRAFCRQTLGYRGPARYLTSNYESVGTKWGWSHQEPGVIEGDVAAPNMTIDIATALRRDPTVKLCVLGGRYDAATPWWNVIHDLSCQFLSADAWKRVELHRYGCGHMAYVDEPTLKAMYGDLAGFYARN